MDSITHAYYYRCISFITCITFPHQAWHFTSANVSDVTNLHPHSAISKYRYRSVVRWLLDCCWRNELISCITHWLFIVVERPRTSSLWNTSMDCRMVSPWALYSQLQGRGKNEGSESVAAVKMSIVLNSCWHILLHYFLLLHWYWVIFMLSASNA